MELEKIVIRTEDYSGIEKGLMTVSYQNPSVKDFIQGYIAENLEQCRDILYQSCLYFEQSLEYLQILGQIRCPADLYARVMNRAIELADTDNIDFFRTYRKAERKGGDAYFQRAAGSISRIGRSLQLISLYRKESCGTLEAFMQAKLDTARRTMKRNAEVLLETDMALFPKAAASAVREGLCADGEELLEEYLDCLMRLRLPLDDEELENAWDGQWTAYKSENIKRLGEYLRTYYYAEMCLAAGRQDEEDFSYALINFEDALICFGIQKNEEDTARINRYESWMPLESEEEESGESSDEGDGLLMTVRQVKNEFREGYLRELCPGKMEDPEEWIAEAALSAQVHAILQKVLEEGNAFWDLFLWDRDSLEFLSDLAKTGEPAENLLAAARQVYDYIKDGSGLTEREMREIFFSLDIETHREGLWSEKELSGVLPDFWEWQEEKRQALVQRKIFAKRWNYWHLTNRAFVLCVFMKELWELPKEERTRLFQSFYGIDFFQKPAEQPRIPWAERMEELGKYWIRYSPEAESLFLSVFLEKEPDAFCQDLLNPLAASLWEKICRPSEQESVHALLEELNLKLTAEDDGALYVSSMSMDNYLSVRGILDGCDLMDQIFPQLSKEQMAGLKEKGHLQEDSGEIKADSLDDSFLKEIGMYDVLTELLRDICLRAEWEEEQDG